MRRLKEIYPDYADQVAFLGVDADPSENADRIRSYKESQGYIWPMAPAERDMLRNYNILTQASKVAVDRNGIIIFRAGYGSESEETWRKTFESLVSP